MGLEWYTWQRSLDRLQRIWVNRVVGEQRGYTAIFGAHDGSFVDYSNRILQVDPLMFEDILKRHVTLPLQWGPYALVRESQVSLRVAAALAKHECGHILYTDKVQPSCKEAHTIWNCLEDERMERVLASHWREADLDFKMLGSLMWQTGIKIPNQSGMTARNCSMALLFHRWDHEVRLKSQRKIKQNKGWSDTDWDLWDTTIRPLTEAAWAAPDSQAVLVLAEQIVQILYPATMDNRMRHYNREVAENWIKSKGVGEQQGERSHGDASQDAQAAPQELNQPSQAQAQPGNSEDEGSGGPGQTPDEDLISAERDSQDPSKGRLQGVPYWSRERKLRGQIRKVTDMLATPSPDTEDIPNNRSGRFSPRALNRTAGRSPVVRRQAEAPSPEGLAVIMLIDGSGSMSVGPGSTMETTIDVALTLERACMVAGVVMQGGITGEHYDDSRPQIQVPSVYNPAVPFELVPQRVAWWRTFETPPSSDIPAALLCGMHGRGGYDSTMQSIREAEMILKARPERTKLILSLHDGEPVENTRESCYQAIASVRSRGTFVTGVMLANTSMYEDMTNAEHREQKIQWVLKEMHDRLIVVFGPKPEDLLYMRSIGELALRIGRLLEKYSHRSGW